MEFSDLVTTETEETVNEGAGKILGTVPGVSSLLNVGNTLEWAFGDPLQTSSSLGIENPRNINPNEMDTATLLWKSDDTTYEEASVVGVFPIKFTSDSSTTVDVRLEWKFESWTLGFGTGRGYFAEQFEIGPY